ncbi:MAG: serine/threonine-protein kinase, partial [Acidobacteriota bacterium]
MSAERNVPSRIGRLEIVRKLGHGGMGDVWEAHDTRLGRRVAVKSLRRSQRWSAWARERFLREAKALSRLEHPNVCRVYDLLRQGDDEYLILELIEGQTLADIPVDDLPVGERIRIAKGITQGLAAAHRLQLIHRDLKPRNVMLSEDGEPKVLDFGLARSADPPEDLEPLERESWSKGTKPRTVDPLGETETQTLLRDTPSVSPASTKPGSVLGTPAFMSPEQARGEPLSTSSDSYSLGLVLHYLFSRSPAHPKGMTTPELLERARHARVDRTQGMRSDLARIVSDLTRAEPAERPGTEAVLQRLERAATRGRRRMLIAAVLVAAFLFAGGLAKYVTDLDRERSEAVAARALTEQVTRYVTNVFFALAGAERPLEEISAAELLDRGLERLREDLPGDPALRAGILSDVGAVYHSLARYSEAEQLLAEAEETLPEGSNPERLLEVRYR